MGDKPLRIALIGAGQRARQVILPALTHEADARLEAVCDIDPARREAACRDFCIPRAYGSDVHDYRRMAEEVRPDAVLCIGQPHLMYDVWVWCLQQGLPLMIEKPLGLTLHQARALAHLAQAKGVPTQVSFQRRYAPVAAQALATCRARGAVTHALCRFYKCDPRPFLGARDHMMDDTVHSIDTLRAVCGGGVASVVSDVRRVGTPDVNFISAVLRFDNGALGHLINSWTSGKRIFCVEIHAPGIYAEVEHEVAARVYADGNLTPVTIDAKDAAGSQRLEAYTGVSAALADFLHSIRTGTPAQCCFADAAKTMEVAETILAQALLAGEA